jgi:xylulokinase
VSGFLQHAYAWSDSLSRRERAPVFLPCINGERTPHNDPGASGIFAGLRAEHGAEALGYAVLEGVAFALADNYDVMMEAGAPLQHCMLVGGGARSHFWGQLIADVLALPLLLPEGAETGAALGAARLAMLAGGAGDEAAVCARPDIRRVFTPDQATGATLAPRLQRFRALYAAEKRLRG